MCRAVALCGRGTSAAFQFSPIDRKASVGNHVISTAFRKIHWFQEQVNSLLTQYSWENNIKIDLRQVGFEDVNCTEMAKALVLVVLNISIILPKKCP
jgi:hypothetical protein